MKSLATISSDAANWARLQLLKGAERTKFFRENMASAKRHCAAVEKQERGATVRVSPGGNLQASFPCGNSAMPAKVPSVPTATHRSPAVANDQQERGATLSKTTAGYVQASFPCGKSAVSAIAAPVNPAPTKTPAVVPGKQPKESVSGDASDSGGLRVQTLPLEPQLATPRDEPARARAALRLLSEDSETKVFSPQSGRGDIFFKATQFLKRKGLLGKNVSSPGTEKQSVTP